MCVLEAVNNGRVVIYTELSDLKIYIFYNCLCSTKAAEALSVVD